MIDTLSSDGTSQKLQQILRITSFKEGNYIIPPFSFMVENQGAKDSLQSNSLTFDVITLEVDTAKGIADIKKPIDTPFTFKEFIQEYLPYIIVILLVVAIGIFVWYYLKKRKEHKPLINISRPKDPPHVLAFNKLDELKEKKLWQKDKFKEYYSELTEILRVYIEDRFNLPAMECTSDEIFTMFYKKNLVSDEAFEKLKRVLIIADLVKFAKEKPLPDENENSFKEGYFFVKDTIFVSSPLKEETLENNSKPEQVNKA
jgi:hypothetical protein